jgi:hypothetical protein
MQKGKKSEFTKNQEGASVLSNINKKLCTSNDDTAATPVAEETILGSCVGSARSKMIMMPALEVRFGLSQTYSFMREMADKVKAAGMCLQSLQWKLKSACTHQ